MLGFNVAHQFCRTSESFPQIWWPMALIVRIGRQDVDKPLCQHPFGPVSRISAKDTSERTRRNLHPDPRPGQTPDHWILGFNPG
jgi:hypothetical protein